MTDRECKFHGKYVRTGESEECPICEYYYYLEFQENEDQDEDDEE